ncbi:MAG: NAD(P)H-dependent oxidoreductase subunit E [Lentisphaeria bacterium]
MDTTTKVQGILEQHPGAGRDSLIPVLQDIQDACGYISRDMINQVGKHLQLPPSKIYGVATFYNQFRFHAPGKFHVQVCRGTACHVKGSGAVLDSLQRELGVSPGATTSDGIFSLEVVACIGACGLAPVISVNGEFHAGVTPQQVGSILDNYRSQVQGDNPND